MTSKGVKYLCVYYTLYDKACLISLLIKNKESGQQNYLGKFLLFNKRSNSVFANNIHYYKWLTKYGIWSVHYFYDHHAFLIMSNKAKCFRCLRYFVQISIE